MYFAMDEYAAYYIQKLKALPDGRQEPSLVKSRSHRRGIWL